MLDQGLFFFLFTEMFQVKFIVPPGVNFRVVQLCLESGYEVGLVLVKSIYRLPYGNE